MALESREHDPNECGCKYVGNNSWNCGHIDGGFVDEYCSQCKEKEHETCSLTRGCPCCEHTLNNMD